MPTFRRIVHPSDFSPASRPAFKKAVDLARSHRAQLLVVHVLSRLPVIAGGYVAPSVWNDLEHGQRTEAERQLRSLVAKAKAAGARASGVLIDFGVTHEQIGEARGPDRDGHAWLQRIDTGAPGKRGVARPRGRQMSRLDCPRLG